ncbi:UDP-Glycosyltransferase superfamily protein [Euphorbia peplus]|nr:UDP-Glycosyltransferase superfamily protein [Euphorbia peplus]
MEKKGQLIMVPEAGAGHIVSTIEFAKSLIEHDPQLSISLLIINLPFTPFVDHYITSLTHSQPNIRFIHVPITDHPPSQPVGNDREGYICAFMDSHKLLVRNIIQNLISEPDSVPILGLVLDLFCPSLIDLGDHFGIPSFIFLTCGAPFLNLMFHLPSRDQQVAGKLSFSGGSEMSIPGFQNPVPLKVFPQAVFNEVGGYEAYMKIAEGFLRVKGIIVNTYSELESYAIESYKNGNYPKVYPVGPLLNLKGHPNPEMDRSEWDKIMKWLDDQPESSVVFLCFGSSGSFDGEQIKEIAMGLEQSGHKFLWCLRLPSPGNQLKNPKDMLPEGFSERVKGRGIISGWAPQVEVLSHKAIGGFVSHCGWNSVLESLWCGVPIATLPIYAEQQLNAFTLVKELGIAVEVKLDYRRNGELRKDEVEKGVRSVMESECERKKVKDLSRIARMVKSECGSSFNSLSEFIRDVRQ